MRNPRRPSPALVISIVALFVALGGTGYAAVTLTGKNVKDGSLTGKDVKNKSLTPKDFKGSVRGARGATGPAGNTGGTGPAGPFTDTLPSGKTLRGLYHVEDVAFHSGETFGDSVSFGLRLPSVPTSHFIYFSGVPPAGCPGTNLNPEASPGHLCVYETDFTNRAATVSIATGRPQFGFDITVDAAAGATPAGTSFYSQGTWAVTAP